MTLLETYNSILDAKAAEFKEKAKAARAQGDERTLSICLMQASMLGDMLKQLGRVDHERIRPGLLEKEADFLEQNSRRISLTGDLDAADREQIKAHTTRFALEALRRLEAENG
ncbi:MAG: hypothetical protein J6U63_01820 [Clostridia bacterium]|nr:hypothetical protein [Clostridia bacterium]